jgi:hypothetical protein
MLLPTATPRRLPPQAVELKGSRVCHVGVCDAATYPMAKKKQSMEFLREKVRNVCGCVWLRRQGWLVSV